MLTLEILGVMIEVCSMLWTGVFSHKNVHSMIDLAQFKRIRIKKCKYFFQSYDLEPVDKQGIIVPLFVVQVCSYILAFAALIFGIVTCSMGVSILGKHPLVIIGFAWLAQALAIIAVQLCLSRISKMRKKES